MAKRGRPPKAVAAAATEAANPAQAAAASPARRGRPTGNGAGGRVKPDFHRQTVLFQWALSKLGVRDLKQFKERFQVSPDSAEGIDERTGLHRFFEAIAGVLPTVSDANVVPVDRLRVYEQNILEHTQAINTSRMRHNQPRIDWKYHQYLALLFTELFLDRYFQDARALRNEINARIAEHNAEAAEPDQVAPFSTEASEGDDADPKRQLARLAFWCATGSGKTLLMHVHVRQFRQHHATAFASGAWPKLDQIILVTPNDGLSAQHAAEFTQSGFDVVAVGEQGVDGLFAEQARRSIKILSIHKFQDDHGHATVATEAFEGCNLVLVDEGHRGAGRGGDGKWMGRRDQLAKDGFCIEYSATFKEAIGTDEGMKNRYARCALFDYAYRSFYRDGYGKDFTILNLEDDEKQKRYLTAALMLYYQQLRVWMDGGDAMKPFRIDKPLWVFVGHTVMGGKVSSADDRESVSDVVDVLLFLKRFLAEPGESVAILQSLLEEGFRDQKGRDLLAHRLPHLDASGDKAAQARSLHEGVLRDVFHAPGGGALAVQLLKGASGELALKVGEAEPFGVVNVGDPGAVADACAENGVHRLEDDANRGSLFNGINRDDSPVNLLVGSRKFTEGWNSWRVSSIGLMRMGRNEGTQIIQLFGRGVRLRGYRMSLRRSSVLAEKPPTPRNLRQVETLQVFGVKASYMNQFRDWIFSEVPEAQQKQVWELPVVKPLPDRKLRTLRLRSEIEGVVVERGQAFRKLGPLVRLRPPHETAPEDAWLRQHRTRLNWLPRVRGIAGETRTASKGAEATVSSAIGQVSELPRQTLKTIPPFMFDLDALLFGMEAFKASRGLDRLHVDRRAIGEMLVRDDWYELMATADDMRLDRYGNRSQWQRMAQQLLNAFAERFYRCIRGRWEAPYIEVAEIAPDDPSLIERYTIETTDLVQTAEQIEQIAALIAGLKTALGQNALAPWSQWGGRWRTVPFGGHLYQPLLHVGKNAEIRITPVALDRWEAKFVQDLAAWCMANCGRDVYLLRNQAVTGLGFFQASNFFPDFLLWVQDEKRQHLAFVDPKGLHHLDPSDPKVQFATRDVPRLQQIVARQAPDLQLHAFILSNTPFASLSWSRSPGELMTKAEVESLGVLFQSDDAMTYVGTLLDLMLRHSVTGAE
ncbi:MAG TPA: DEAD/DEAH box helicase family protein [Phycisphaerales bacterium]|nr:DEAD/DEAH box helicase family protein [Phycisphaerales bacterium]HMP36707.1 DEAD/DEAH box helicase family protein [Phycisphaerales bacterium]